MPPRLCRVRQITAGNCTSTQINSPVSTGRPNRFRTWVRLTLIWIFHSSCPNAQPIRPVYFNSPSRICREWNTQHQSQPNQGSRPAVTPCTLKSASNQEKCNPEGESLPTCVICHLNVRPSALCTTSPSATTGWPTSWRTWVGLTLIWGVPRLVAASVATQAGGGTFQI